MATRNFPVYVPADLLQALGEHTGHFWSDPAMEPIIYDAISASMKPAPAPQQQAATSRCAQPFHGSLLQDYPGRSKTKSARPVRRELCMAMASRARTAPDGKTVASTSAM